MDLQNLIGTSAALAQVREDLEWAAKSDAKVLLTGESGVGKEVVARLIHRESARNRQPFVAINCAGIPETLLASELFGHARGSFTDAHRDRPGWLEQAHMGTIFLDEVGEMSQRMQALLLRFLETGEIQRVGGTDKMTMVNVRVITATNRQLLQRVASNDFREDLYYRLNVVHIEVPPLRQRRDDIPVLFDHFMHNFSRVHRVSLPELTAEAKARIVEYEWPGNVRELRNLAERVTVRARGAVVTESDLPGELRRKKTSLVTGGAAVPAAPTKSEVLLHQMLAEGESFWPAVHAPFMARDLTREDLRAVIRVGLTTTFGSYKSMVALFNMPPQDYKRFLSFLHKYQAHLPIHEFRALSPARAATRFSMGATASMNAAAAG